MGQAVCVAGGAETKLITEIFGRAKAFLIMPPLLVLSLYTCFSSTLLYIPNLHVNSSGVKCLSVFNKGWKCPGYWPGSSMRTADP